MSLEIFDYNQTENIRNFSLDNTYRITSNKSRSYSEFTHLANFAFLFWNNLFYRTTTKEHLLIAWERIPSRHNCWLIDDVRSESRPSDDFRSIVYISNR